MTVLSGFMDWQLHRIKHAGIVQVVTGRRVESAPAVAPSAPVDVAQPKAHRTRTYRLAHGLCVTCGGRVREDKQRCPACLQRDAERAMERFRARFPDAPRRKRRRSATTFNQQPSLLEGAA